MYIKSNKKLVLSVKIFMTVFFVLMVDVLNNKAHASEGAHWMVEHRPETVKSTTQCCGYLLGTAAAAGLL
jgi:hypothetical protein